MRTAIALPSSRGFRYGQHMTDGVRNGLAMICLALVALVLSLATASGDAPLFSGATRLLAVAFGVLGLVSIAVALFRRS